MLNCVRETGNSSSATWHQSVGMAIVRKQSRMRGENLNFHFENDVRKENSQIMIERPTFDAASVVYSWESIHDVRSCDGC